MSDEYDNDHPTTNTHDPLRPWACQLPSIEAVATADAVDWHGLCPRCVEIAGIVAKMPPFAYQGTARSGATATSHAEFYEQYRASRRASSGSSRCDRGRTEGVGDRSRRLAAGGLRRVGIPRRRAI